MTIKLVSFVLCPFVQRAAITLAEKQLEFSIEYIDLGSPPDWFKAISPLGKVPLLLVDGEVLFESAVIIEYLDEVYPPRLHPADPLRRARHRAWIEYGSGLLMDQHALCIASDAEGYEEKLEIFRSNLLRLETPIQERLFGGSESFSLVDAAYAPLFMRMALLEEMRPELALDLPPGLGAWSEALRGRPSVAASVVDDFRQRYIEFFAAKGSWLMRQVTEQQ